jgi:hypothetical protein
LARHSEIPSDTQRQLIEVTLKHRNCRTCNCGSGRGHFGSEAPEVLSERGSEAGHERELLTHGWATAQVLSSGLAQIILSRASLSQDPRLMTAW